MRGVAPQGSQAAVSTVESPWQKQIRDILQPASVGLVNNVLAQNTGANMPDVARVQDRSDVAKSIFDRNMSLMEPTFAKENNRLLTNLQARGIPVGADAFSSAYKDQQTNVNEAISRLADDANIAAGNEQSRQFSLDSAARSGAMNEIMAALTGQYNANSNAPSGNAAGVNYSGLVGDKYNADRAAYNAKQQQQSANAGTLGSLGGALLMKSDRRLKRDIRRIVEVKGFPLYEYRYVWDKPGTVRRGVMAQDLLGKMTKAVHQVGKYLQVDYAMLARAA